MHTQFTTYGIVSSSLAALMPILASADDSGLAKTLDIAEASVERSETSARPTFENLSVDSLLRSLTFEDYAHREAVIEEISSREWPAVRELARLAADKSTRLDQRARYAIRRGFWRLTPKIAAKLKSDNPLIKAEAERTFRFVVETYPLDEHHHGGLQKLAIVLEKLGHHDLALEAYRRWVPPSSWCGNCAAEIQAEKTTGLIRCLRAPQTIRSGR